ncbi:MAG: molybdopterin-dependent oxidoreductase [Alphaproteobacteria bacterium]|nr:molybdopterin-dependent oxidoreductase [Alphaproteobacteria bacterium]
MTGIGIKAVINGQTISLDAPPTERLTATLRRRLGLTGTKVGCDAGDCGACSVLLDGEVVCACMVAAAQIDGCSVTTIEGLASDPLGRRLQQAFLDHGAAQCGICTPGMLNSALAVLRSSATPDEAAIEDALGGVLCRCTGYRKIIAAVVDAARGQTTPGVARDQSGPAVGRSIARLDGPAKITGREIFGADGIPADALALKIIRSPHHRARFAFGDLDGFIDAHPGLIRVLTAADIPGSNLHGVIPPFLDQPVFAEGVARFRGEAVAAVLGEPEAVDAIDGVDFPVTWEELPPALGFGEAADADILASGKVMRGDVEAGFADADVVLERKIETAFVEHAYIEPEAGFARRVGGRIEIQCCTQAAYMNRDAVAAILGVEREQVRILPSAVGGGFGAKLDLTTQPYIALAAWLTGRPVGLVYSRPESMMASTKRHPADIAMRAGVTRSGRITALAFDARFDTGAYASWGPTVATRVPIHAGGPYVIPNYRAHAQAFYSNGPVSGAFRGFGVPQAAIAQETLFDQLADALGMDRLAFRLENALDNGVPTVTGQVFSDGVGIKACLKALQPHWVQARDRAAAHYVNPGHGMAGVGLACCWYGCGNTSLPNPSTIKLGLHRDGQVVLYQGAVDIGQGSNTVIAQIASDALGLPLSAFRLEGADTETTPDAGKTSASRQTFVTGMAAKLAGEALRRDLLRHANASSEGKLALASRTLEVCEAGLVRSLNLETLPADEQGFVALVQETFDPTTTPLDENGQGDAYALFGYGAHLVELVVDIDLGTVKLTRITAAHDVGRAINPQLVEGQIEGGIAQGIGMALMEDYRPGRSENLHDYLIPTIGDVPEIETIIVEEPASVGPFGAKGLGEHALIPTAPAILNAIRDATGAIIGKLPATPDRVLAAIEAGPGPNHRGRNDEHG